MYASDWHDGPLEPVGFNAVGLHMTTTGIRGDFGDDASALHVADRAGEPLDR